MFLLLGNCGSLALRSPLLHRWRVNVLAILFDKPARPKSPRKGSTGEIRLSNLENRTQIHRQMLQSPQKIEPRQHKDHRQFLHARELSWQPMLTTPVERVRKQLPKEKRELRRHKASFRKTKSQQRSGPEKWAA